MSAGTDVALEDSGASIEQIACAVWSSALGNMPVLPDDTFISLGGTSLAAAHAAADLQRRLRLPVTISQVLAAPTFAEFAQQLETAAEGCAGSP